MRLLVVGCLMALTVGCFPKATSSTGAANGSSVNTTYVPLDWEEELAALEEDEEYSSALVVFFEDVDCGDLKSLEPAAMVGGLTDDDVRCLEEAYSDAEKPTVKDKLSLMLMHDAKAKGNNDRWEHYANRHLMSVGTANPDICYLYAKHQYKKGIRFSSDAIKYAKAGLENSAQWKGGNEFVSRVYNLHKIIAFSSYNRWEDLNHTFESTNDDTLRPQVEGLRNKAKTASKEWLEFARSANRDMTAAMSLCEMATGSAEYCAPE
jgi:hypothetical protein